MGCKYCHESSTVNGKHGDLNKLLEVIAALQPPRRFARRLHRRQQQRDPHGHQEGFLNEDR